MTQVLDNPTVFADMIRRVSDPWQIKTRMPNGDELSTVLLPIMHRGGEYESCWFYADGTSDVVARYYTERDAVRGHGDLLVEWLDR